jgi:hypothetical protein
VITEIFGVGKGQGGKRPQSENDPPQPPKSVKQVDKPAQYYMAKLVFKLGGIFFSAWPHELASRDPRGSNTALPKSGDLKVWSNATSYPCSVA